MAEKPNGVHSSVVIDGEEDKPRDSPQSKPTEDERITLSAIFNRLISAFFFPNSADPLLRRTKASLSHNLPLLRTASSNTGHDILLWTRRGSPLRALLVVSLGTIALLAFTGFMVFMLFFAAATINAIVISLLISLAAAGGFLAMFFTFLAAIYVGALAVAIFVISATTISAIIAALVTTGWIGFFYTVWLVTQKVLGLAKQSFSMTGSVISAAKYAHHNH